MKTDKRRFFRQEKFRSGAKERTYFSSLTMYKERQGRRVISIEQNQ